MVFRVVFEQDEDEIIIARCPALPGCISQGRNHSEALANIKDAISGYLESLKKHHEPIPPSIQRRFAQISIFYRKIQGKNNLRGYRAAVSLYG